MPRCVCASGLSRTSASNAASRNASSAASWVCADFTSATCATAGAFAWISGAADSNNITKQTALTESGEITKGRGDDPNQHDILTGSNADGTLATDMTCGDWTLNGEGSAMVGHVDRVGPDTLATATSWNAAHPSRGCSQENLVGTGGAGMLYCFAPN